MKRLLQNIISLTLAIIFVFHVQIAFAAMTSTNYQIQWDDLSTGGGIGSSSSYQIRDSMGDAGSGPRASSTSYAIDQGFRSGIYDPVANFLPYIQDSGTQVAATAFTTLPPLVSVTTAAGFAVNDWIVVVQDEGASQVVAMAQISGISGLDISIFSSFSGGSPTVDGSNDFVYRMSPTASIGLGALSSSAVATRIIGWVATADVPQGYSMYMFSNGDLTDGSDTIAAVSDGSVTAGASEYGGRSSDSTLATSTFDTQDTAFTTDPALVCSVPANDFSSSGFVTVKAAISSSQPVGSYTQTLTAVFVGDY